MDPVEKLISLGGAALSAKAAQELPGLASEKANRELIEMLRRKNGFYVFESALHIFPAAAADPELTLSQWNAQELWRKDYGDLAQSLMFFAEDAFGNQFAYSDEEVVLFDAETGKVEPLGRTLAEWAAAILKNYNVLTGYPLLHPWQLRFGALPVGTRLMPKIPFVLGGAYSLDNVYALKAVSAMRTRGNLARQIKDLPDGAQVQFRIIE